MDKTHELLAKVLSGLTPTKEERAAEEVLLKEILLTLKEIIRGVNHLVQPIMVGSMAKGTDLRGDKDFDIFIQFPANTLREKLESQGLLIGKRFFEHVKSKPELSYAEHPYVKGTYKGYDVEIVPCYRLSGHKAIISAVDRTPLHTEFVLGELSKKPGMQEEIRLLKRFMKAHGLYGAHAAVEGFSGYLCELLVIKYGSFVGVLKAAASWKKHERLELQTESNAKFHDVPLVFIDPVDEGRNVAAAVSVEKLAKFIYMSEAFLAGPNERFFDEKRSQAMSKKEFYDKLRVRGTELICVHFRAPKLVEDTLVPQLAKSLRSLAGECERADFKLLKKAHWTDGLESAILLEFEVWELPRVMKKSGPFFDSKVADMRGFIEANKSIALSKLYLEYDEWCIDVEREHLRAIDFVNACLKDPKGFGKDLRGVKRFDVLTNSQLTKIKSKSFWEFMEDFW